MIVLKARVHFLLFNPTDKSAAITYVDGAGIMHRATESAKVHQSRYKYDFIIIKATHRSASSITELYL